MLNIINELDGWLAPILGSISLLALIWLGVWFASFWQSRKQHRELIVRLHRIEAVIRALQKDNYVKKTEEL